MAKKARTRSAWCVCCGCHVVVGTARTKLNETQRGEKRRAERKRVEDEDEDDNDVQELQQVRVSYSTRKAIDLSPTQQLELLDKQVGVNRVEPIHALEVVVGESFE